MVQGGEGRGAQDVEHVYTWGGFRLMCGKPIQYCKVINLQLNKFILKNKGKNGQIDFMCRGSSIILILEFIIYKMVN